MKIPNIRVIFDRHGRASKTNQGLVQIEVQSGSKRKFISTGVKIFANEWNDRTRVKGRGDASELNKRIDGVLNNINEYVNDVISSGKAWDWDAFEKFLDRSPSSSERTFIAFIADRMEKRTDLREGTMKHHRFWFADFDRWGGIVSFSDITPANIRLYDEYLHTKGVKQTTIYNYHKHLKSYINDAIEFELLQYNPYQSVKIERGKSEELRYLTPDEVESVKNLALADESLQRVRDVFVFQCYTGMAYADLAEFRLEDCVERDGRLVYRNSRVKTDGRFTVVILSEAKAVLDKYGGTLPLLSNQKYNEYLKVIQVMLGIKTVMTSHVARHSFAVMAINRGVPIEIVARMMGHTKIETTQIYAKVLNRSVEDAFDLLEK